MNQSDKYGRKVGYWEFHRRSDDSLHQEGSFIDGEKDGEWLHYDNEGNITKRLNWKVGKKHGLRITYYEGGPHKGKLKRITHYHMNRICGYHEETYLHLRHVFNHKKQYFLI